MHEEMLPCSMSYDRANLPEINLRINSLVSKCKGALFKKGFQEEDIKYEIYLNLRYERTDFAMMVTCEHDSAQVVLCDENNYRACFLQRYMREFGFTIPDRRILLDDIRVRGIGVIKETFLSKQNCPESPQVSGPIASDETLCYFEEAGFVKTPIYLFENLKHGHSVEGPAMIIESNCTILVEPFCIANVTQQGNILIDVQNASPANLSAELDPIYMSIFGHLFMSIAEQMGKCLQHAAVSTNIKERLDFSCALFNNQGHLVRLNLVFCSFHN